MNYFQKYYRLYADRGESIYFKLAYTSNDNIDVLEICWDWDAADANIQTENITDCMQVSKKQNALFQ